MVRVLLKNGFFFGVTSVLSLFFGLFVYFNAARIYEKESALRHEIATTQLESAASTVEYFFGDIRSKVSLLIDEPEVKSYTESGLRHHLIEGRITSLLSRLISHSGNIKQAYIMDLEGNKVLHADSDGQATDLKHWHIEEKIRMPRAQSLYSIRFVPFSEKRPSSGYASLLAMAPLVDSKRQPRGFLVLNIDLSLLFKMVPKTITLDYSDLMGGGGLNAERSNAGAKDRSIVSKKISDQETLHYTFAAISHDQFLTVVKHHRHVMLAELFMKLMTRSAIAMGVFLGLVGMLSISVILRIKEKARADKTMMHALIALTDWRDPETGNHLTRTQKYSVLLARKLREGNGQLVSKRFISDIFEAAPLHDIGKVGIKDSILLKPGKLTPEEFNMMKEHVHIGQCIIQDLICRVGQDNSAMKMALNICVSHHEKFDGSGYPDGLKGSRIPLEARIFALADVYDALRSERPYKKKIDHERVVEMIKRESGQHFDPKLVDLFLQYHHEFRKISEDNLPLPFCPPLKKKESLLTPCSSTVQ